MASIMSSLCRRLSIAAAAPIAAETITCRPLGSRTRMFSTHQNNPPPTGLDFHHWTVVPKNPPKDAPREQIIDYYVKILAQVVGSEEEARKKIYSVSTKYFYQFGANIPEELTPKLQALPDVLVVVTDSYEDAESKSYGGEPVVDGVAAPYDPKYHRHYLKYKDLKFNTYNKRYRINFPQRRGKVI